MKKQLSYESKQNNDTCIPENGRLNRLRTLQVYQSDISALMTQIIVDHHDVKGHSLASQPDNCDLCDLYTTAEQIMRIIQQEIDDENTTKKQHFSLASLKSAHYYYAQEEDGEIQIYRSASVTKTRQLFRLYNGNDRMHGMPKRINRCLVEIIIKYIMDDSDQASRLVQSLTNDHVFSGLVIQFENNQLLRVAETLGQYKIYDRIMND
ncbi:hypothetical protein FC26_GL000472 [Paucilactobacillus vaccinostercus DSM 20634]|uniref:Uncharacterized protein n=1 Tax=Paucilactobacillus vaccinostercus DSM 20634 TaxID=1423813 RepID=A0A0R2A1T7_9LACO|nr:hypothetical protein [Paucilactobacillus vaccinostercus]KRM60386.1 hypothetical protein FC26_GL000472 [Paucilactobacillus vaccinostercus DSM 20634]